jgi:kumamolisin
MAARISYVANHHRDYVAIPGAKVIAPVDPEEQIEVTLVVRPRQTVPELHTDRKLAACLPRERHYLSREEFELRHGAHPDALAQVEKFARSHRFEITEISAARHSVVLQGRAGDFSKAFRVEMLQYDHARGLHRGIRCPIQMPQELRKSVHSVLGLHNRPTALRHASVAGVKRARRPVLSANNVAELYRFPRNANGAGQCIGVIELGGGYHRSDLESFFSSLKLPLPKITDVSVGGAQNAPAEHSVLHAFMMVLNAGENPAKSARPETRRSAELAQCTAETTMDIELVGAFAPGAHIVAYFAPNNEQGIYHALTTALADKAHRPSVLSLSWGEPEPNVCPKYAALIDTVLKNLASVGVTVCVSSGDFGAHNGMTGKPSVNFPASSPNALGCGGTTLKVSRSEIESEVVWNSVFYGVRGATGGGVSQMFPKPFWQDNFQVPRRPSKSGGRGVPDVAAVADPETGCRIVVGGMDSVSAGTSAVAPLWAGLVARLNHAIGAPCGYLNSILYRLTTRANSDAILRAITHGENGVYQAGPHWNACTGLGSPHGDRLLEVLNADKSH